MLTPSRRITIALLTLLALAGCKETHPPLNTTEPTYMIGNVEIAIPAPATDMVGADQFIETLSYTMPADIRIVAAHALQDEIDYAEAGNLDARLTRYAMIQVVRSTENLDADSGDFDVFVQGAKQGMEQLRDNTEAMLRQSGVRTDRMKEMGVDVDFTNITYDGEIFRRPDAVGLAIAMPIAVDELTIRQLCTTAIIRTRGRIITANMYVEDDGRPETKQWLHDTIEAWAGAILAENGSA